MAGIPATRFWSVFDPTVAASLSAEQRAEVERVFALDEMQRPSRIGDLRVSFRWFFIRFMWGPEKRSADRRHQDAVMHPAMTKKNAPGLLALGVGYTAVWYMVIGISAALLARHLLH